MQKQILLQIVEQNRKDCFKVLKDINADNTDFRLTDRICRFHLQTYWGIDKFNGSIFWI